nr:MAG TPA: hypothetical protein [Bacteriophage sp.]
MPPVWGYLVPKIFFQNKKPLLTRNYTYGKDKSCEP